jgi:cholest-4-en-3-one 26-monooxygenase
MTSVDQINFLDSNAYADGRAEEWLTYLRNNEPVWYSPDPDPAGQGVWMVTKHADVSMISKTPHVFSSATENGGIDGFTEVERAKTVEALTGVGRMFIMMDPPEHGLHRRNLQPGFSPRTIASHTEHIQAITNTMLDRAIEKGRFDFIEDVAAAIPLNMVADVLGVPESDRNWLFGYVMDAEMPSSPELWKESAHVDNMRASIKVVRDYGRQMLLDRKENPTDDLMSRLAHATVNGEPVPLEYNVSNFYTMWAAGAETTRTALAWGMYALLKYPGQWEKVRANPELLSGTATEEILRWSTPVHQFRRNVMEDVVIQGVPIKRGEAVVIWYTSANWDEEVFDDPFTFDVLRDPNPHITFGGGGPHFCMGAHLSRLEIDLVFREIIRRVREPKLLAEPTRFKSARFRGLESLEVDFTEVVK